MKIFLIYVRDEDYYKLLPEKFNRNNDDRVRVMAFPPLGIQTLAPVTRQHGHEVILFDTCHPEMKKEHIAREVISQKPDVIALSFLSTTAYKYMKQVAKFLKSSAPEIPIIIGGPFTTKNAELILMDCEYVDFAGIGEGEELLPDFLKNILEPEKVKGLAYRKDGQVIRNPDRPMIQDLDQFPYPDRKSLPVEYIESLPLEVPAVLSLERFCTIQTSRGCPYTCIYCDIPLLSGGSWRSRSPEHVLGEMKELNEQGYRSIYLTDDHFLQKRKRIQAICNGILENNLQFTWGCEGRVDSIAVSEFPLLKRANCTMLAFGVEAGTQKILDRLKKRQKLSQIEYAINEAKKSGIDTIHGFFLVGSPDETEEDILESFRFAARLKIDTFGFNRLSVYRGTPLWNEYVERGIIDDRDDWNKWFRACHIDPTVLSCRKVHAVRSSGYKLLFRFRLIHRPMDTLRLIRKFSRYMTWTDLARLILSPFRKKKILEKPDLPEKMIRDGKKEPIRLSA
ncbi:MAG: B12-binding domain-containing radical SAM protein [Cyclobacteriaceae bacterium]|nr:B12-binding domain-containing radical SAM protein [Cyclobacteriaceae bacterium]